MVSYKALNTILETGFSQTRDGVGNGDGDQTAATSEAVISQALDGVGNGDGGQTAATSEAVISKTRDGVGNGDGDQTAATSEAVISQALDVISKTKINHSFRDYNLSRIRRPPLTCNRSSLISPIQVIVNPIHLYDICPRGMKSQE